MRRYLLTGLVLALLGIPVASAQANPFSRRAMWIWYVASANAGSLSSIIGTAHSHGIGTVIIKSADGTNYWSQFSPQLVGALHAAGLNVCGWQYVYPSNTASEAQVGADAKRNGADCLLIDAEGEFEGGHYVDAQTYIRTLRRLVGPHFALGLAGLPYVDYHPSFPYSVFFGQGGAQYNEPQMYWDIIGTSVDEVYAHTYTVNAPYGRTIVPLGDTTANPPPGQIIRFRQVARPYRAANVAWWEWSQTPAREWWALSVSHGPLAGYATQSSMPVLSKGASGDLVVSAQERLWTAGQHTTIDGGFGPRTQTAVRRFQRAHGLGGDGVIGPGTWAALLRYVPVVVTWTASGAHAASLDGTLLLTVPKSSRLRAKRYEIPPHLGRGMPPTRR